MLLDAFLRMSAGEFPLREYQYTGFGSIFFVDFSMFRKYLGMYNMLSVEHDKRIERRVVFNRPWADITIKMGSAAEAIPELDSDLKHVLWLDYDFVLNKNAISDLIAAATKLSVGSILLITIDVEAPCEGGPKEWKQYFEATAGELLPVDEEEFGLSNIPRINVKTLRNAVQNGLAGRKNTKFLPLFNFLYADTHPMLTLGGMIGGAAEKRNLDACDFASAKYLRRSFDDPPYEIRPPILTRKERLILDSCMPCADTWMPAEFEIEKQHLAAYRELYPYFPQYVEAFL
jgi:hypothetical protein